jgi:hypothetical protein
MRFVAPQVALDGRFERFPVPVGGAHGHVSACRVEFLAPPLGLRSGETSAWTGDDTVVTMSGAGERQV